MLGAAVHIIVCTGRNRLRQRLRRLREPRYLIGAVVGISYLVFSLFIRQRAYRDDDPSPTDAADVAGSALNRLGPSAGGMILAAGSVFAWFLPFESNLLVFSRAEMSFLFPAPVTRRQLLLYRLMRSQLAVLIGALIMALAYPTGTLPGRVRGFVSVWLLLMTGHVFFTGVTLARDHIRRGKGIPAFAWPAIGLATAACAGIAGPLVTHASGGVATAADLATAAMEVVRDGSTSIFLLPFTILAQPLFADSLAEFLRTLIGAIPVYLVAVAWLFWADSESAHVSDASVERVVNLQPRRTTSFRYREVGWRLDPVGNPEGVFLWKGALRTLRTIDRRALVRAALFLTWMIAASLVVTRARGLLLLIGVFATWGALFTAFIAPQIVRVDLREDLAYLAWLKGWPLRGAAIIRGEILWPAALVTCVAWAFAALAFVMSLISRSRIPLPNRGAAWLSLLILIPGIVLAQYTIHNAIAVVFPGWVPLGTSRPRGVDAAGQRLILLVATWFALILAVMPGVAVTGALAWLFRSAVGPWVLPVGALVTTATVVGEMMLVTEALGPTFERLDVTSTERPE
jgi:hypothetical protein